MGGELRERSVSDGRVVVSRLSEEGERRLMRAFVVLRDDRRNLAQVLREVTVRFEEFAGINRVKGVGSGRLR